MEMTTIKTVAVFAIIFGCFALLYPRIFHPMLLHMLGMGARTEPQQNMMNQIPPHMRQRHPGAGGQQQAHDKMRSPHPHPGMRAAGEMKRSDGGGGGGARGVMTVVLPIYAVGIVIYLIYTLTKVFRERGEKSSFDTNAPFRDIRFDPARKQFVAGEHEGYDEDVDVNDIRDPDFREFCQNKKKKGQFREFPGNRKQERGLEDLLMRAEDNTSEEKIILKHQLLHIHTCVDEALEKHRAHDEVRGLKSELQNMEDTVSRLLTNKQADAEMTVLKRRFLETEKQMSRILAAMETVQQRMVAEEGQDNEATDYQENDAANMGEECVTSSPISQITETDIEALQAMQAEGDLDTQRELDDNAMTDALYNDSLEQDEDESLMKAMDGDNQNFISDDVMNTYDDDEDDIVDEDVDEDVETVEELLTDMSLNDDTVNSEVRKRRVEKSENES